MAIRVVEFSNGGYKIRKILPENQHTQMKLLNFENWVNGEVSKIGHHFTKGHIFCTEIKILNSGSHDVSQKLRQTECLLFHF